MAFQHLLLEISDHIATVTLQRPEKLNALDRTLQREILDVCATLKQDDTVRAVIITGAGRGFCSGADVSGTPPEPPEHIPWQQLTDEESWVGRQARAIYHIDKPTIAAVNGIAAGAGFSLALACDIRIGSEHARFKAVFIERNLSPDSGMSYLLPRIVGQGNALDLVLTSRTVDAAEALRIGVLQRLVPHEHLLDEARAVASQIAALPPIAAIMSRPRHPAELGERLRCPAPRGDPRHRHLPPGRQRHPRTAPSLPRTPSATLHRELTSRGPRQRRGPHPRPTPGTVSSRGALSPPSTSPG